MCLESTKFRVTFCPAWWKYSCMRRKVTIFLKSRKVFQRTYDPVIRRIRPSTLQTTPEEGPCHGQWRAQIRMHAGMTVEWGSVCHLASKRLPGNISFFLLSPCLICALFAWCLHVPYRKFPNKNVSLSLVRKILNLNSFFEGVIYVC